MHDWHESEDEALLVPASARPARKTVNQSWQTECFISVEWSADCLHFLLSFLSTLPETDPGSGQGARLLQQILLSELGNFFRPKKDFFARAMPNQTHCDNGGRD